MELGRYSFGLGDRFGRQGMAQLRAVQEALRQGVVITPVWNKSYREHHSIGTSPKDVRMEADRAVAALNWDLPYFVDADHVNLKTVDLFIPSSDFFTLDIADSLGQPADERAIEQFVRNHRRFLGTPHIPGLEEKLEVTKSKIETIARKFLFAVQEAGRIYRHICEQKRSQPFIVEVSLDETKESQTPLELLFILSAIAQEKIPVSTLAPKFTGRLNKGVDYEGDRRVFASEFEQDLLILDFARREFGLPKSLKLSVHSGSDKFSLYPILRELIRKNNAGLHLKTAGTTWLEELIGLAEGGEEGAALVKEIYRRTLAKFEELTQPYTTVIDIDAAQLPPPETVDTWPGERLVRALRHNQSDEFYNPHFRQALHIGYKVAAEIGEHYLKGLERFAESVSRNVTENLLERHIRPLFLE